MFTPQEAVDMITTAVELHRDFAGPDILVVWSRCFNVEIHREGDTGRGIAYRWPFGMTIEEATDAGDVEWVELTVLECSRITNYLAREVRKKRGQ